MSRKKKPPEPSCPHCGCPEVYTFLRQLSPGGSFVSVTSCPACGKVVTPPNPEAK